MEFLKGFLAIHSLLLGSISASTVTFDGVESCMAVAQDLPVQLLKLGVPLRNDRRPDFFRGRIDVPVIIRDNRYTWSLTQSEQCIRRFDGFETVKRDLPGVYANSMVLDHLGRIWVGVRNEIVVVLPDKHGEPMKGDTVRIPLPNSSIKNCTIVGDSVYFRSLRTVARVNLYQTVTQALDGVSVQAYRLPTDNPDVVILTQGRYHDKYVVGTTDGIFVAQENGFERLEGYQGRNVYTLAELVDGRLFTLMTGEEFRLNSYVDGEFLENIREGPTFSFLMGGTQRMSDGRIVAPMNIGVGVFRKTGEFEYFVPEEPVVNVFVDQHDVVWVSSFEGVFRFHLGTELTTLTTENGLPDESRFFFQAQGSHIVVDDQSVYHLHQWQKIKATGTATQLRMVENRPIHSAASVIQPDLAYETDDSNSPREMGLVADAILQDGRVWICADHGVFYVKNDLLYELDSRWNHGDELRAAGIEPGSKNQYAYPRIFCRNRTDGKIMYFWDALDELGVTIADPASGERHRRVLRDNGEIAVMLDVAPVQGRTPDIAWLLACSRANNHSLYCYHFDEAWVPTRYELPLNIARKFRVCRGIGRSNSGQVLVATDDGVFAFEFDTASRQISFESLWSWDYGGDDEISVHFDGQRAFVFSAATLDVWENGRIVAHADLTSDLGYARRHFDDRPIPFHSIQTSEKAFSICRNGVVFFGSISLGGDVVGDATADLDRKPEKPDSRQSPILLRVEIGESDDPLNRWPGEGRFRNSETILINAPRDSEKAVSIRPSSLVRVDAAVSELFQESKNEFKFELVDLDRGEVRKTDWRVSGSTTYNPAPGNYELTVRARGIRDFGKVTLPFSVSLPWYQTTVGRAAIAGIFGVGVLGLIGWRVNRRRAARLAKDLVRSEDRFQTIFESSLDAILTTTDELNVVDANPSALELFHVDKLADLSGESLTRFIRIDPSERDQDFFPRKLLQRASGALIPVELRRVPADGTTQWHLRDLRQEDQMKQQVERSAAADAMGLLAGSIAHDFRNVLGTVSLSNESLVSRDSVNRDAEAMRILQTCDESVETGTHLARQLMNLGAPSTHLSGATDLCEVVRMVHRSHVRQAPDLNWSLEMPDEPVGAIGAAGEVMRALVNLYDNAIHAVNGSKSGAITVSLKTLGKRDISGMRSIDIEVRDNGAGIPPDVENKLFQPYVSTRLNEGGTGLGLYSVKEIMKSLGGDVSVDRDADIGTCFVLHFCPAAEIADRHTQRLDGLSLLVVDDDPRLQAETSRILEGLGAKVAGTTDSAAADEMLRRRQFNALISDYSMEPLNGMDLAKTAKSNQRSCVVVLVSGFTELLEQRDLLDDRLIDKTVSKPASGAEIAEAIVSSRSRLDGG